ncbi:MAG: HU family DNA-binding protein [Clostridia bacterium]|nr:HU family DNA-binding protein [Clostridia bacterium]
MNKTELISALAAKTGMTKKDSEKALTAVIDTIVETLQTGEKVQIVGFGNFEVRERAARIGHNPQTHEEIQIEASKAPVFRAGKAFKEAIK